MNTITTKKDTQISCNHWGSGTYIGWELRGSEDFRVAVEELRAAGCNPEMGSKEECSRTHCFAYVAVPGRRGMQHFCVEAHSIDGVGLAYDLAQQRKLPITLTMGRHQMDALVSFYMRTPSGFDMEFGAGGALLDDDFAQLDPSNPELWGHKQLIRGWAPTVLSVAK